MVERMEIEHTEDLEILPSNIGSLPSTEAAPLLTRAASRIDIVRPKSDFWKGIQENLKGASGWIEAHGAKVKRRSLNIIAGASLVTTMVAACSKPPETPYLPTEAPRVTEVIPTEMPLPTETPTQIPTETPTIEPSPTPTEIPKHEGPLIDIDPWITRDEEVEVRRVHEEQLGVDNYYVDTLPATLISAYIDTETQIGQEIWGFRLNDKEYRFRISSAQTYIVDRPDITPGGIDVGSLTMGESYRLTLMGFETPVVSSFLWGELLVGEQNLPARELFENLRRDPEDAQRLADFFMTGKTDGFTIDQNGFVDLTEVAELAAVYSLKE